MHPFGGTPVCPRCNKAVYAAEQVMGPGRKLYHKPCLTCTGCSTRLDALRLLEHDQEPYCKNCHSKYFGTRDLRQANLPHRSDVGRLTPTRTGLSSPSSPDLSPPRAVNTNSPPPARNNTSPPPSRPLGGPLFSHSTVGRQNTGAFSSLSSPAPLLQPTRTLSPTRATFPEDTSNTQRFEALDEGNGEDEAPLRTIALGTLSHAGRFQGGLPRTVPLTPERSASVSPTKGPPSAYAKSSATPGRSSSIENGAVMTPLTATATGTRYGAGLMGGLRATPTGGGARQWGGGTPQCPKCGKSVYFAEQVKAVGKTYHKACLRCTECNTSLDSGRLTEKDGMPLCHRCYSKLHGPAGSGYALLGKAGG
ncbi:LIM-domain-containing protein [Auriscalpium vulgare]|uniref:LIM-domain-containing protein n=1 Tax=Auriscalpium vulgare TaxID=40419 RepID=A0ACB8RI13_9AGAM|nr:LIM-domain-containing protein [Auriscalpium vulgare]